MEDKLQELENELTTLFNELMSVRDRLKSLELSNAKLSHQLWKIENKCAEDIDE